MRGLIKATAFVAVWFISAYALRYLFPVPGTFGIYEPRYVYLIAHVAGGIAALLLGPAQFWLALNRNYALWHRIFGVGYLIGVGVSSSSAIYLAWHTDFGWVFAMGMITLAVVWITTTGLAVTAICRFLTQQHAEWMIRSYVVTFSFVTFRVIVEILEIGRIGTMTERLTAASWLCWSIPLLITESIIQGRKIFLQTPVSGKTSIS